MNCEYVCKHGGKSIATRITIR